MSINQIEQGLDASAHLLSQAHQFIQNQIRDTFLDRIPGVDVIAATIEHLLEQSANSIYSVESEIKTQIAPLLQNALPDAVRTLIGIAQTVESDIGTLVGEIATVDDVTQTILTELKKQSPHLAQWLYGNVVGQFGNVALGVLETLEKEGGVIADPILDELLQIKGLPPWLHTSIAHARGKKAPLVALIIPAIILASILPVLQALGEPIVEAVRQGAFNITPSKVAPVESLIAAYNKGFLDRTHLTTQIINWGYDKEPTDFMIEATQERLNPADLAQMHFRGIIDQATALQEMRKHGLSDTYALWQLAYAGRLVPEDALRNAFLRNIITAEQHDINLGLYGYPPTTAQLIRELYFFVPPVSDLIHMGIRNVFVPEIVERFGLDRDKPQAFVDAAHQQGISEDWAGKYWQAHWIMPGREAFFEMFQRTVDEPIDPNADKITLSNGREVYNIIGRDTLNLALRDIDTPPFYRDKLTQIAYRPFTRIDIRRMASIGELDHAEVERAYLDLGYNQVRARKLADFVDRLNQKVRKDEAATLVDGLRREVLRLYIAGKLSEDAVHATLIDLLFTKAEIDVFVKESNLVRESQYATALETGIGKLYVDGIITDKEATQRMSSAGIPVPAMGVLFTKWDLEREFKGGSSHLHKHRELTAAEVEQALADGLITPEDARQHFLDMGFDDASAQGKVSLTLYKASRAIKQAQVAAVRASFVNGTIEALDASSRLDALLVPAGQRDGFLATWSLERETRTERIPLATLRDMAQGGYITWSELFDHLKRHRYTDNDANLIIKFWQAQKPPKSLIPEATQ